jgi:hypothetical protein
MPKPELVLKSIFITKPITYSFKFEEFGTWCNVTINDDTAELSIQSDWGCWAHRWPHAGLGNGRTLTEFFVEGDPDYFVRKFQYNRTPDLEDVRDLEKTWEGVRARICYLRRNKRISSTDARHYWTVGKHWVYDADYDTEYMDNGLCLLLNEEPWEYVRYRKSGTYVFFAEKLLPLIQKWLKGYLNNDLPRVPEQPPEKSVD